MIRLRNRQKDDNYIYHLVVKELVPYAQASRPETRVSRKEIFHRLDRMNVWIACRHIKDKPAGFLSFREDGKDINLDMLAVGHQHQNRGYGGELIGALERYGRSRNINSIRLFVDEPNGQAINFYLRKGYSASQYFPEMRCYSFTKRL